MPDGIQSAGGSNFAFYQIDSAYLKRNEPGAWWKPGVLNHIVGAFHLQEPGTIEETLRQMYSGGQRKIAFVLWHTNIASDMAASGSKWGGPMPREREGTYGHTIESAGGRLTDQHQKNLVALLQITQEAGFRDITIRFAAQGVNNPMEWERWEEAYYLENLQFILSVKQIVDSVIAEGNRVWYDLGLELAGLEDGNCPEYTDRLWRDYTDRFGVEDTMGFSFAVEPNRITRMLEIYRKSGRHPAVYPLDIYYEADKVLAYVAKEFRKSGIADRRSLFRRRFTTTPKRLPKYRTPPPNTT